jgi:hypothetical protein
VKNIIATLLLVPVCSLYVGVAHSADPPNGTTRVAAISALDPAARPKTPQRAASTDVQAPRSSLEAVIPEQRANPPKAAAAARATLDLRPPDVRSIQGLLPPEDIPPADADETQDVAIVGGPTLSEESLNTRVSSIGVGAVYWAGRHPAQAWRVLLPIVPRDGSAASEDIRVKCATFERPPSSQASCP